MLALALSAAATGCGDAADDIASRSSVGAEAGVAADHAIEVPDGSGEDGVSAHSDVGTKRELYERHGLRELWLADTASRTLLVYRRSRAQAALTSRAS